MSLEADKIEDGYEKRWFKNSLLFIFNNPVVIFLYLMLITGSGMLILYTPLKHGIGFFMFIFTLFFFIFLMQIQYEASYKKITILSFFKIFIDNFKETFKTIFFSKENLGKFVSTILILIFFDYYREAQTYPTINKSTGVKLFYDDIILKNLMNFGWIFIISEYIFNLNSINDKHARIPFSLRYVLNKFSNFSQEKSVNIAIDNLLFQAYEKNKKAHYFLLITSIFLAPIFIMLGRISPIFSFIFAAFIPIFFFQVAKETFLDQGNKKHQKQEEKETKEMPVPDPSGA